MNNINQIAANAVALAKFKIDPLEYVSNDQLGIARKVITNVGIGNMLSTTSHLWLWKSTGVWRSITDRELKQIVQRVMDALKLKITRGAVDAVSDVLKTEVFFPEHAWNRYKDGINFLNGMLLWHNGSFVLYGHSREYYYNTQLPVIYDPNAQCPIFWKSLLAMFENDQDCWEKATALLEMIGYTLFSHTRFERFVILVGRGANGKSVILEVIRLLVGAENVAAVQPSQFSNKFQRAHLHGKLANIVTEVAEGAEIADAELKAIVSGESMTAEHKHQTPFDFSPFCTVWLGTNHMPHTRDFSDALFRRALVIPFNRVFKLGVDADPLLKEKLASELSGIANSALRAYAEVLKRGSFTEPLSCKVSKLEWRMQADQAAQFVEEMCVMDVNATIESGELYRLYVLWASNVGISRKLGRNAFTSRLKNIGALPTKGTNGQRLISGIRLANSHGGVHS